MITPLTPAQLQMLAGPPRPRLPMTLREFSAAGGRAGTGKSKARDSAKMRAAAEKRWAKWRKKKGNK